MFIRRCQYSQNMAQYPFGVCEKSIDDSKESSFFCDLCNFWVHTKCNQLRFFDFQHIKACTEPWFCFNCISDLFTLVHLIMKISVHLFLLIRIVMKTLVAP